MNRRDIIGFATLGVGSLASAKVMAKDVGQLSSELSEVALAEKEATKIIYHITVGDENWEASVEDMQTIADLFSSAIQSAGGYGSVVATRPGVSITSVKI